MTRRPDGDRGGRRRAVLALLVLGGASVAAAAPTWLTTYASTVLDPRVEVTVTGTSAAPGVSAAALVVVAAGLALGLVGRVARWFSLLVVLLGGLVVAVSALTVVLSPEAAARSGVAEATGIDGATGDVTVSVAAYLAVLCGLGIVAVAVRTAVAPIDWGSRSTRYDTPAHGGSGASTHADAGADGDGGAGAGAGAGAGSTRDGTGETAGRATPGRAATSSPRSGSAASGTGADLEALDERDAWDALTQGDDPS